MTAFFSSKLCLLLSSLELSRRLAGSGVALNIIDPGPFKSNLAREMPWPISTLIGLFAKSADQAAEHVLRLATSDDLQGKSGLIFVEKKLKAPMPYWKDQSVCDRLWSATQSIIDGKLSLNLEGNR
jgi:NAD(P)-dependent dehydrogenase (short-subunit alcohol dehydrogenase family)